MDATYAPRYRSSVSEPKRIRASVCKIHFYGKLYDFDQPYNTHLNAGSSKGTGFVLDAFSDANGGTHVVTAYHVVDNASRILCEFTELQGQKLEASVVAYSVHLDVALLHIAELTTPPPLVAGNSDLLQPTDAVIAAGFALGHDYQITSGTVSGRSATLVQVDCAVNGGNSGGPLLNEAHEVIGVVVSGYDPGVAQNINFVSPIVETVQCLAWARANGVTSIRARSFNATVMPSNEVLYRNAEVCENGCPHGGYVTQVHPDSALHAAGLRRKDVLCEVDGYALDLKGKVETGWWSVDRLDVDTLLQRKFEGDTLSVIFWSHTSCKLTNVSVEVEAERNVFRTIDPLTDPPIYSVRGGLVVQPLISNHERMSKAYRHILRQPQVREQSLLVVTFVRPESPFTSMDTVQGGDIVTYLNDRPIETIADYIAEWTRWDASTESYAMLTLYDGNVAVATRDAIQKSDIVTLKETGIQVLQ